MKPGDFVLVDFVGRIKDTREIFDITEEDIAKKEGIHRPGFKYKPVPMIVGSNFILPGLNDALKEMKVGEKKTVDIPPEKAFGNRNPDLIKLIPESRFKKQGVNATPGSFVTINRIKGKIISVDGGRVKVDFNHPLAGKVLEYELKILKKITKPEEKIKSVFHYFTGLEEVEVAIKNGEAEINIKKRVNVLVETKERIAKAVIKWVKGIKKVKFIEEFE